MYATGLSGVLFLLISAAVAGAPQGPLAVGDTLQLFVDGYVVDRMEGVELRLAEPRPQGVALRFDKPWEGNTSAYALVLFDGERYRMYYRGSSGPSYLDPGLAAKDETVPPEHPEVACYAESDDGIVWRKPELGLHEFAGSKANNIIWIGPESHDFAPFLDGNPRARPEERFKAFGRNGKTLRAFVSADGIHWKLLREEPVLTDGYFDSLNLAFWDPVNGQYRAVYRDFRNGVRTFKSATSQDFVSWTPGEWADFGDAPIEQFYTNAVQPYFRAPQILLGFPKRFVDWRKPSPTNPVSGVSDSVFLTSRDGVHWDRRFREAFIRPGRGARNWVHRSNMVAPNVVPTGDGELSLYVSREYTFPTAHLERMTLRLDGFVSAHSGAKGGELLTRPLVVKGTKLVLNFATSAAGSVRVELQDPAGNPLPGWALEDQPAHFGDEIAYEIPLAGRGGFQRFDNQPVRLRFVLKDADLYSFRFSD